LVTGLPSWDSHSHNGWQDGKADRRVNSAEVLSTSYKNMVNFGSLTPEFMVMVWRPFMREIVEPCLILGSHIQQWMAGTAGFVPNSHGRHVWSFLCSDKLRCHGQKSKVKVTTDKKSAVYSQHPHRMDRMECPHCRHDNHDNLIAAERCLPACVVRALGLAGYCR